MKLLSEAEQDLEFAHIERRMVDIMTLRQALEAEWWQLIARRRQIVMARRRREGPDAPEAA
jgi:hypothetical protein